MSLPIAKSVLVKGKVQGVFFRASALVEAQQRNLTGFVKNVSGGDVYIEVFGPDVAVYEFISWCHSGPEFAKVAEIVVEDIDYREEKEFVIAY